MGRTEATGFGVICAVREAMKHLKLDPKKCSAAVQGFGNVAQYAAIGFIEQLGGKVVCVSCYDRSDKEIYTYFRPEGVNPHFLQSITDQYGTIDKAKAKEAGYLIEDGETWIAKDVEVLIHEVLLSGKRDEDDEDDEDEDEKPKKKSKPRDDDDE